jgi:hypothetical protein
MTISIRTVLSSALLTSLVGLAAASTGCTAASDDGAVKSRVDVINQTKSALSAASITSISGLYAGSCDGRDAAGFDNWTISMSGGPAADELSVRKNDSDCVLTIVNIVTAGGTFIGNPAIALSTADTYKNTPSAFKLPAGPLAFYGNAKIDALSFSADFTISLLVSDAPRASDQGNKGATFATQSGTVAAGTVPASAYTVSFASFGVAKDVNNVVQSVSGYAQLAEGSVTGQDYAIHAGALNGSSAFADVDAAFAGASTRGLLSDLTSLRLPASGFGLGALDLDNSPQRTVIVRNTDQGVSSYQLLMITFVP